MKAPTKRMLRVNQLVRREVSDILHNELDDPALRMMSVTEVAVTADFETAYIHVSHLHDRKEGEKILAHLIKRSGHIRKLLGKRVSFRVTPNPVFKYDESIMKGTQIIELLRKVESELTPEEQNKNKDNP